MRVPRIYTEQRLSIGHTCELNESTSHYLTVVLRLQVGRELILFNGKGGEYRAVLNSTDSKKSTATVLTSSDFERESPLSIRLAIGISRGERMDWVIQKATELGVTDITPLFSTRTEVKLSGSRLEKKWLHWNRIIISACEQCQRNTIPHLAIPQPLCQWLDANTNENKVANQLKFVLHHRANAQTLQTFSQPSQVTLLVGPEGGLSEEEIKQAEKESFITLSFGPRVLRTETAPVTALSILQYQWGDLSL